MYNVYIKKAVKICGIPKTRQIYEKAILDLEVEGSRLMCMKYAELETKLGEIDRARAIYVQCSQMCDPRVLSWTFLIFCFFEYNIMNIYYVDNRFIFYE